MSRAFLKQSDESSGKKDWILISNRDNEHLSQNFKEHLGNCEAVSKTVSTQNTTTNSVVG